MADAFCSNTEAENEKEQVRSLTAPEGRAQSGELTYTGGCHCQAVRFECQAPSVLECWDCNCSICRMKQNTHFMVPEEKFTLQQGEGKLTTYTFNTGVAKHTFCQVCGIQAFYRPRSNPDCVAVTLYCLDNPPSTECVVIHRFDGENWEQSFTDSKLKGLHQEDDDG